MAQRSGSPVLPRCLVVQHVECEGPAALARALRHHQVELETCRVFAGDPVPRRTAGFDGLLVMGGPMSAAADPGFPTRAGELSLLQAAVHAGVPTLGVCLGAQLLSAATGGRVLRGEAGLEIGWGRVRLTDEAGGDLLFAGLPPTLEVLHWHGDTFELGAGSVLLASSERYPAQAFRAGVRAWGLQFHLEVDEEAAAAMVHAFPAEAQVADGGAAAIVAGAGGTNRREDRGAVVLERFAALVAGGGPESGSQRSIAATIPGRALD
ncbi:MAG TPA: type 1 glutamine amidotransferase [Acidimicrobiales bacterium]|nr:type 1 glutamine amidotransferase [Acidimicrobiales bacterium]